MNEITIEKVDKELLEDLDTAKIGTTEAKEKFQDIILNSKIVNTDIAAFCIAWVCAIEDNNSKMAIKMVKQLAAKYFAHGYNIAISQMVKDE